MRQNVPTRHLLVLLLVAVVVLGLATEVPRTMAAGADVILDWWSTSGGGGLGTGASFTLHGSVGQPDAGVGTSQSYTLIGGVLAGSAGSPTTGEPPSNHSIFIPIVVK